MLYEQLYETSERTSRKSVSASLQVISGSLESTTRESVGIDQKMRAVELELDNRNLIGTLDSPNDYFRATMRMRWGLFNDYGKRPDDEPALVYFGGFDKRGPLLVGLGGSSKHVVGHEGASSTYSRSATPILVEWLLAGVQNNAPPELPEWHPANDMHSVYSAMAIALHYLRPPNLRLEFVAKTLSVGDVDGCEMWIGAPKARVILGSPLWVAQAPPYVGSGGANHWGLDEGWSQDDSD